MEADNQQKILGYFIEEAKEHLETLEKGLVDLFSVASDPERVNEMFRAAHSLKGGAAMLGYGSIQKTAHRLEDAFKVLKEYTVFVDQQLVSLFLAGYDILRELLEELQAPYGLADSKANEIFERGEPIFQNLQDYLATIRGEKLTTPTSLSNAESFDLENFGTEARQLMRQMLKVFRGQDIPDSRNQLLAISQQLLRLKPQGSEWQRLVETTQILINNPKYSYSMLAPIIIQELKRGADYIQLDRDDLVAVSDSLQQLADQELPQFLVPLEPSKLAQQLRQILNQEQLNQLIQYLQ